MTTPTSVVRGLLRAVRKHVTSVAGNTQWRDFIVARVRADAHLHATDPARAKDRLSLAADLKFLITNVRHHKSLLQAYNLGTDPEDRNKQMVEAVAKRVGFRMPNDERQPRVARPKQQEEAA